MATGSEGRVPAGWWESSWLMWAAVLLSAVPLIWPDIPPLVDLPGHMGRYAVELGIDRSAWLARYYQFDWHLIGNLGIDLLIVPMAKLFGIESGTKLIVLAIPPLTALGFLLVAREAHGRIPPAAFFALPLAYGYPFQFGFVNFALSMALAFLAYALWLRLGNAHRLRLRTALFLPLSTLIWVCHTFGWGTLGLLCLAGDIVRHRRLGHGWGRTLGGSVITCLPLAPPALLMLAWRSGHVSGATSDWFNWPVKWLYLKSVLRERWMEWDQVSAALLLVVFLVALAGALLGWCIRRKAAPPDRRQGRRLEPTLLLAAAMLALTYALLPRIIFGSAYADMRLAPFVAATALLAIGSTGTKDRLGKVLAIVGLTFFMARTATTTAAFATYDRAYDHQLRALDHVPQGARILALIGRTCRAPWQSHRLEHLASMAIVRRHAFVNDQWVLPGAQLLTIRYRLGRPYTHDASQMVPLTSCRREPQRQLEDTIRMFPRHAFDYVWMMHIPRARWPRRADLTQLWSNHDGVLYRVEHSAGLARRS